MPSPLLRRPPALASARTRVVSCPDGCRVVAVRPARPGERLLAVHGVPASRPSRHSLQMGPDLHLVPPPGLDPDDPDPRYAWRYLNHACAPNTFLDGRAFVALRPIAAGEEVTFDYHTTEYELACPFPCRCGACGGRVIRGFRHLTLAERLPLAPRLTAHLLALVTPATD